MNRLLVANRGEIACRVLRAARSLGMSTVAVFSEADASAPHVTLADFSISIGAPKASESYLDGSKIIAAARSGGARYVHPGYGFLSENAAFAEQCAAAGLVFIGPRPDQIRAMGDKQQARATAAAAGVPILPGTERLGTADAEILAAAKDVGYPLLVKAAAGGGGIGMRQVDEEGQLLAAVSSTRALAERAFGSNAVYLERRIPRARHVEVQVFGLGDGRAVHLFERDCTLQRRHQKIIEEAPAPNIPAEIRAEMAGAAVSLAEALHYAGAGTIEYLYDEEAKRFFFLEMNTRIQVEHPVTEEVTGVDLVRAQIQLALGDKPEGLAEQAAIRLSGHAVEARVYAERPAKNFVPSPGMIEQLQVPSAEGIRIESGYAAGQRVTPFYDPMLMKVIAHGRDRQEALARLDTALGSIELVGIETNISFLRALLRRAETRDGRVYTRFVEDNLAQLVA